MCVCVCVCVRACVCVCVCVCVHLYIACFQLYWVAVIYRTEPIVFNLPINLSRVLQINLYYSSLLFHDDSFYSWLYDGDVTAIFMQE